MLYNAKARRRNSDIPRDAVEDCFEVKRKYGFRAKPAKFAKKNALIKNPIIKDTSIFLCVPGVLGATSGFPICAISG